MREYLKFYIDGQWVDPTEPKTLDVDNPTTEQVSGKIAIGTAADVDKAVKAASKAFATWSVSTREDRLDLLGEIAAENVYVLDNPEPLIVLDKFDASGINILLGTWFEKSNYLALKNSIMIDVKKRFAQEGISIPLPQVKVHFADAGSPAAGEGRAFPSHPDSVSS